MYNRGDRVDAHADALMDQVSALLVVIEQLVSVGEVAEASAAATVLAWLLSDHATYEQLSSGSAQHTEDPRQARLFEPRTATTAR